MPHRHEDWLTQAERDLEAARHSYSAEDFEWCAYAAQQSAEKALKALLRFNGREMRGHTLVQLLETLQSFLTIPVELTEAAQELDLHYFRARYPDSLTSGYPAEVYGDEIGQACLRYAESFFDFVHKNIS